MDKMQGTQLTQLRGDWGRDMNNCSTRKWMEHGATGGLPSVWLSTEGDMAARTSIL